MHHGIQQTDSGRIVQAVAMWPEPWRDRFDERVAILQHEAGHVHLTAHQFAYSHTLWEAESEGVKLPDPISGS